MKLTNIIYILIEFLYSYRVKQCGTCKKKQHSVYALLLSDCISRCIYLTFESTPNPNGNCVTYKAAASGYLRGGRGVLCNPVSVPRAKRSDAPQCRPWAAYPPIRFKLTRIAPPPALVMEIAS